MGLLIAVMVVLGMFSGMIAAGRGNSFGGGFVLGLLLGPIGLLITAVSSRSPEAEAARQKAIEDARRNLEAES